nr:EAL domain-containing protein [Larsenimonas rhizosphaerae]
MVSQVAILAAVLNGSHRDIQRQISDHMDIAVRVMEQTINQHRQQMLDSAEVLISDYGFRSAVASQDNPTIESALNNYAARIGADLMTLNGLDGRLLVSTRPELTTRGVFPFTSLWRKAHYDDRGSTVTIIGGMPYVIILLPVKAPDTIGWVSMGFAFDTPLLSRIKTITELDISLLGGTPAALPPLVSTLSPEQQKSLDLDHTPSSSLVSLFSIGNARPVNRQIILGDSPDGHLTAVLSHPTSSLMAPYLAMRMRLIVIFFVTLVSATMLSLLTANTVGQPIKRLTDVARRIGDGERIKARPPANDKSDLGVLASTLHMMQDKLSMREAQLLHQSRQDLLTGLPNRQSAEARLATLTEKGMPFTLNRLCINEFKRINDTFGHVNGDRVLIEIGTRLRQAVGDQGFAYRIGGDEYLVLYPGYNHDTTDLRHLHDALASQPVLQDISPINVSISMGQVHYPTHGPDAEVLLRRADIALNDAKHSGSHLKSYSTGMDEQHLRRLAILQDLRTALLNDRLYMVYQPKIDLRSGKATHLEALVRWEHDTLGFIPPDEFITLAEHSGNIAMLTDWVLHQVAAQIARWNEQHHVFCVSVNLSAQDLTDHQLPARIAAILAEHALSSRQLVLEITESALMEDPVEARRILEELRRQGLHISIDDFGTGYSSLSQLRHMPIDELKIDKSFILKLDSQFEDVMIVRSIIDLGHNLGLSVTAEGVENLQSLAMLEAMNCDVAQGFLFARPLKAQELLFWFQAFSSKSFSDEQIRRRKEVVTPPIPVTYQRRET